MIQKKKYKNPPIVERIIGVYADIKPEVFEAKMPGWADKIKSEYPIARPESEWTVHIKEVNGIPFLEDTAPTAEIIHLFWKPHKQGFRIHGMRLRPSRLVFHLVREGENPHDFEELYVEMVKWINVWMEHFEVPALKGVTAEYFNRLNGKITPQFMLPDGRLKIEEAFVLFSKIPGKYNVITAPYENRIRLVVDKDRPCFFDLRVQLDDEPQLGVKVDFMVMTIRPDKAISAEAALAEIRLAHDVILEEFDCLFTEAAKRTFIPDGSTN